jgi:hypothetical protein
MENNTSSTGQSIKDMDPLLLDFARTRANSFVKWELMRLFHDNPHRADTAENIARDLERRVLVVKSELEDLVTNGIMTKKLLEGVSLYAPGNDEGTQALVDKFVLTLENRHFRVRAVDHILPGRR